MKRMWNILLHGWSCPKAMFHVAEIPWASQLWPERVDEGCDVPCAQGTALCCHVGPTRMSVGLGGGPGAGGETLCFLSPFCIYRHVKNM